MLDGRDPGGGACPLRTQELGARGCYVISIRAVIARTVAAAVGSRIYLRIAHPPPATAPGTTSPPQITRWAYRGSSVRNYARRPWRRTVIRRRAIVVGRLIAGWPTISRSRTISRWRFIFVRWRIAGWRPVARRRPIARWWAIAGRRAIAGRWAEIRGSCAIEKGSASGEQHCGGGSRNEEVAHDVLGSRYPLSSSRMKCGAAQRLFVGRADQG